MTDLRRGMPELALNAGLRTIVIRDRHRGLEFFNEAENFDADARPDRKKLVGEDDRRGNASILLMNCNRTCNTNPFEPSTVQGWLVSCLRRCSAWRQAS